MLQNKITSELQRIALFCSNNFMKLRLWLWIPFCQFTVHMLYVLLSLLHCKLASIVSQIWIVTQKGDALKLLQSQFQHKWWYALKLQQRSGVQHKRWCTEVCGKDLDSNTNSDGCTAQAVAQIWIPTQNVMWWMHKLKFAAKIWIPTQTLMDAQLKLQHRSGFQHKRWWMHKVKLQQRSGFWDKRWWIHISSYIKELDTTQKEYALSEVAAKIWIPAQKVIDAQLKLQKRSGLQYQGDALKFIACCCNPLWEQIHRLCQWSVLRCWVFLI